MDRRLASRTTFFNRLWRGGAWALVIIGLALAVGIAGYSYFGGMGFAQAFANAAMILSGMGPLDKMTSTAGHYFEGLYALASGLIFFAVASLILSPVLHRVLHRFHIEDEGKQRGRDNA